MKYFLTIAVALMLSGCISAISKKLDKYTDTTKAERCADYHAELAIYEAWPSTRPGKAENVQIARLGLALARCPPPPTVAPLPAAPKPPSASSSRAPPPPSTPV